MTLVLIQQSTCMIPGIEAQLEDSIVSNVIVVPWSAEQQNALEHSLRDNVLCRFMEGGLIAGLKATCAAVMNRQAQSDTCRGGGREWSCSRVVVWSCGRVVV